MHLLSTKHLMRQSNSIAVLEKVVLPLSMLMVTVASTIVLGLIPGTVPAIWIHRAIKNNKRR